MLQTIFANYVVFDKSIFINKYYLKGSTYFSFKVDLCKSREMTGGQNIE